MNKEIYESNMRVFEKSFPGICEIINQSRDKIENDIEVFFEKAADESDIIKIKKGDRELYINGKREPADKVRIQFEKWGKVDKHAVIFATGLADITFLKQLVLMVEPSVQIVIYEPSLTIFLR